MPGPAVLHRAALAAAAWLFSAVPAAALDCAAALAALRPGDEAIAAELREKPHRCALIQLADGQWAAAVAHDLEIPPGRGNPPALLPSLTVALLRADPAGAVAVAGPVTVEAQTFDPLRHVRLRVLPTTPLGPALPAMAVELDNLDHSMARSDETTALHLFLRRERRLLPVFAGWLRLSRSRVVPCARRPVECRAEVERAYAVTAATPPRPGSTPPDLLVRDSRTGRVVSRHRWSGEAYSPARFARSPRLAGED